MARLIYGGIELQILKTHHVGPEDVYDDTGLDYLWTKWVFDVTGVINLAATAYAAQQGNPTPVVTLGTPAFHEAGRCVDVKDVSEAKGSRRGDGLWDMGRIEETGFPLTPVVKIGGA